MPSSAKPRSDLHRSRGTGVAPAPRPFHPRRRACVPHTHDSSPPTRNAPRPSPQHPSAASDLLTAVEREQQIADFDGTLSVRACRCSSRTTTRPAKTCSTRAFPLLALIFVGEILGSFSLKWPLWANVLAVLDPSLGHGRDRAPEPQARTRGAHHPRAPRPLGALRLRAGAVVPQIVTDFHGLDWLMTLLSNLAILLAVLVLFGFRIASIVVWRVRQLRMSWPRRLR